MADTKISALTAATTPLAGTEVLPIVQSGVTKQVSVANLTAGRAVSADSLSLTNALTAANGGTGQSSYTIGDLLYASGATALSKLADVATGNALISGGVGAAPSWGKIGLTTHISGTLAVGNGGTGNTTGAATAVTSNATTGLMQIVGPAAASTRVMTIPDANFTAARTDAAQTFSGTQTFSSDVIARSFQSTTSHYVVNPSGAYFGFYSAGGVAQTIVQMPNTGVIAFWKPDTSEIARFHNSGGFSLGNTTDPGASNLCVSGTGWFGTTSAYLASRIVAKSSSTDNSTNILSLLDSAGTEYFRVRSDGYTYAVGVANNTTASAANVYVGAGGDLLKSTSALKYKQNVRDLEDIDINLFRPVRYKSKCAADDQTLDHFGLIADEIDAVGIKEVVNYSQDGSVDGLQYERLIPVLIKRMQIMESKLKTAGIAGF